MALAASAVALAACGSAGSAVSIPASSGDAGGGSAAASSQGCTASSLGYPKVAISGAKVGFSQSEPNKAAFRVAETQSMVDEAKARGATLVWTSAEGKIEKQVADIESLLDQGVQLLIVAPLNSEGLQPAFEAARAKKVPVVTVDRLVTSTPCTDYLTFIGSDFVSQGRRAAEALITATGGKGEVVVLLGSAGNGVTTDRTKGFVDALAAAPGLKIVAQQTGNFDREQGRTVMASLLAAHPGVTAVYAENDEMGVGAVAAITAVGKKPGVDVKVQSIDGTKDAVKLLKQGLYNGVVESNPRFGPLAFQALEDFENEVPVPAKIVIQDDEYTPATVAENYANAF